MNETSRPQDVAGLPSRAEADIDSLAARVGPIVWVTLARPEKANALDRTTVEQLLHILTEAERDESVRVLILMGAGRHFCAGADLAELLSGGSDGLRRFLN